MNRIATIGLVGAIFALVLAACGGGGGSSTTAPPTVGSPSNGITVNLSQSSPITLPAASGIASTIQLSSNNAPAGATLFVSVSTAQPPMMTSIPVSNTTAFAFFSLQSSTTVTFHSLPKIALTLPKQPQNQGQFYAWIYDTSAKVWTDLGTVTVSGSTLDFGGNTNAFTLKGHVPYIIVAFTAASGASCPTPPPTNCPTPTPGPTVAGAKFYLTTGCRLGSIATYNENEQPVAVSGTFTGVGQTALLAFDSANNELYVTDANANTVTAYDLNGNHVATPGGFPNLHGPLGITFDPVNQHLYVVNTESLPSPTISVYDQGGNQISTSGSFPGLGSPFGITFDSSSNTIYVTDIGNKTVEVYDQNGNRISTSGSFPGLDTPRGVLFDPFNARIYVSDSRERAPGPQVSVFTQDGNPISVSGQFVDLQIPSGMALDPSNRHIYIADTIGQIQVYDEDGNLLPSSFVEPIAPFGIVFVP